MLIYELYFFLSQVKVELDKMVEAKDQAMKLYESMKGERVGFIEKEKDYKDRLNKIGVELEAKSISKLSLMDNNKFLKRMGENVNEWATMEKKKAKDEWTLAEEERAQASVVEKAEEATKWAEEVEIKAVNAVEFWKASSKFDALVQDAYMVALEEIIKNISKERLGFNTTFLE